MSRVAVIGGGAAGMLAAIAAAEHGHQVQLFEKKREAGEKKYILQERDGAMLPTPVIQRSCLQRLCTIPSFFTAAFTALQTRI